MGTYDWIVVGAGITGAALSYELAKQKLSVLLLEQFELPQSATRLSYGGIAFWSGTTELMRQLCAEGIAIHRSLSEELEADTQFRELDLLLTIGRDRDPQAIAAQYQGFAIPPKLLTVEEAFQLEPLLDPTGISGALTAKHGHIEAELTANAYIQAFQRLGGTLQIGSVVGLDGIGVKTAEGTIAAKNVVFCTGGMTRHLLQTAGISIRQYFTHAELIETAAISLRLKTLVMPAESKRFALEAQATQSDEVWDVPDNEPAPAILDAGVVQLLDGRLRIGQVSRTLTDVNAIADPKQSEQDLRREIGKVLPAIAEIPGKWHRCLVAFSRDKLPLVGEVAEGIYVFSGFSNPLAIVPAIARRFSQVAIGQSDELIEGFSPQRFV
jgi:glycine/D-amino acid oxidase-like deaminating enzyme